MIIVSQNKNSIYNFENVKSIDIIGNEIFITDDILADIGTLIAEYKTEERAREILSEIYKKHCDFELIKILRGEYQRIAISGDNSRYFDIYEMPKE